MRPQHSQFLVLDPKSEPLESTTQIKK